MKEDGLVSIANSKASSGAPDDLMADLDDLWGNRTFGPGNKRRRVAALEDQERLGHVA